MDGIELCALLSTSYPNVGSLILSDSHDPKTVEKAARAGAIRFLSKTADASALIEAVRAAASPEMDAIDLSSPAKRSTQTRDSQSALSPAQQRTLEILCRGGSNREIAQSLQVSIGTVKKYLKIIYRHLGVERRTEAAAEALRRHLV
jgi:DNA-binding NarL/FixJ family response regulator